ncbi:MAG: hypothetical protein HY921_10675 [Elusimicrobia bacterium]|nr:hypothetical protein [Elusimicrobiota bacterium]
MKTPNLPRPFFIAALIATPFLAHAAGDFELPTQKLGQLRLEMGQFEKSRLKDQGGPALPRVLKARLEGSDKRPVFGYLERYKEADTMGSVIHIQGNVFFKEDKLTRRIDATVRIEYQFNRKTGIWSQTQAEGVDYLNNATIRVRTYKPELIREDVEDGTGLTHPKQYYRVQLLSAEVEIRL